MECKTVSELYPFTGTSRWGLAWTCNFMDWNILKRNINQPLLLYGGLFEKKRASEGVVSILVEGYFAIKGKRKVFVFQVHNSYVRRYRVDSITRPWEIIEGYTLEKYIDGPTATAYQLVGDSICRKVKGPVDPKATETPKAGGVPF